MADQKEFYELFNKIDGEVKTYEKEELNDFDKARMKKNVAAKIKKRRIPLFPKAACACILLLLIGIFGSSDKVQAAVESVTNQLYYYFGARQEVKDYVTVVNRSYQNQGFQVSLEEATANTRNLVMAFNITSEEPIPEKDGTVSIGESELYMNGKRMDSGFWSSQTVAWDAYHTQLVLSIEQVDKYVQENPITIDYRIRSLSYGDGKEILQPDGSYEMKLIEEKGKWDFHFTVDTSELEKNTRTIKVNKTIEAPDGMYVKIKDFTISPLEMSFQTEEKKNLDEEYGYNFAVNAVSDKGESIYFDFTATEGMAEYSTASFEQNSEDYDYITLQFLLEKYSTDPSEDEIQSVPIGDPIRIDLN
ncbi:MAG: DUF4179 domain-containing protein [Lachnospiraceae bacterium]|nr:DUF4179 domain-containing protein [Lachnospiraceae bacterium]